MSCLGWRELEFSMLCSSAILYHYIIMRTLRWFNLPAPYRIEYHLTGYSLSLSSICVICMCWSQVLHYISRVESRTNTEISNPSISPWSAVFLVSHMWHCAMELITCWSFPFQPILFEPYTTIKHALTMIFPSRKQIGWKFSVTGGCLLYLFIHPYTVINKELYV